MARRLEVSLHVDHDRDVLSIGFAPVSGPAAGNDEGGTQRRARLHAVRMQQLSPHMVAKYGAGGWLVGIDLFEVSRLVGLSPETSLAVAMHTSYRGGKPDRKPPVQEEPHPGGSAPVPGSEPSTPRSEPPTAAGTGPRPVEQAPQGPGAGSPDRVPGLQPGSLLARLSALLAGRRLCPHCSRPYARDDLKFKRFLRRSEAERIEKVHTLRSHFVYACPHCRGDLYDT